MELISVHIPKTAGVTFRTLLREIYPPGALKLDYGDRALDPVSPFQADPARWRADAQRLAVAIPEEAQVVHGHFNGAKYDAIFPSARKIVWLREPISRLVSHYHYWRKLPPSSHSLHRRLLDERMTLLEFARLEGMRNILARVFLRNCRLEGFAFVGIQEHFSEDLRRLGSIFGWPDDVIAGEENCNPELDNTEKLSDEERAEITVLNAGDIAIYQRALSMRWVEC